MAFGRNLAHRFLDMAKTYSGQIRSGFGAGAARSSERASASRRFFPDSADRRTQCRPIVQSAVPSDRFSIPFKMLDRMPWTKQVPPTPLFSFYSEEKEREHKGTRMALPPMPLSSIFSKGKEGEHKGTEMALKASQMELVRSRLSEISENSISSSEFLQICSEASSAEHGPELARSLDESGAVIFSGNLVLIKPNQVVKAIEKIVPHFLIHPHDPRKEELRKLELQKEKIDKLAADRARKELWCGLAFMVAQTAGFFRLTFWELSWDVMEPICFFVTSSSYFMIGYFFFLRTSAEFSFEGLFNTRFATKQRHLMKAHKFDLCRFNELKGVFYPSSPSPLTSTFEHVDPPSRHCMNRKNALASYAY